MSRKNKKKKLKRLRPANEVVKQYQKRGGAGAGPHHQRELDVKKGKFRRRKHKKVQYED